MTRRAPESRPWIEILARVGFVAKGVLYATIGMLAGCALLVIASVVASRDAAGRMPDSPG